MIEKPVSEALAFRHACRSFAPDRPVTQEEARLILNAAHNAPSSYGLQPWKFVVVNQKEDIRALAEVCYNQASFEHAPMAVSILSYGPKRAAPDRIKENFERVMDADRAATNFAHYKANYDARSGKPELRDTIAIAYCRMQAHIAASLMSAQAAGLGLDSLIMGGIEHEKVSALYGYDPQEYLCSLVLLFGARSYTQQPPRHCFPLNEVLDNRSTFGF